MNKLIKKYYVPGLGENYIKVQKVDQKEKLRDLPEDGERIDFNKEKRVPEEERPQKTAENRVAKKI